MPLLIVSMDAGCMDGAYCVSDVVFFFFFFFFFKSTTYIVVYSKQSARYSKLHLLVPDGHEEDSKLARITPRARVGGSVNHRHVNMRSH